MIFAQLSVTLTAVKKVSAEEEQMAACTLHRVSFSVFEYGVLSRIDFFCFLAQNRPAGHIHSSLVHFIYTFKSSFSFNSSILE